MPDLHSLTPVRVPIYAEDVRVQESSDDDNEFTIVLACETPFERHFGMVQLECSDKAVILDRLKNNGPLLCDHDRRDIVGAFTDARVEGKFVVGKGKWSKSARAAEVRQDVKDRIRTHVSPGLWIHEMKLVEEKEGVPPLYRVTRWEPEETSIVSVAAMDELSIAAGAEEYSDPWQSEGMLAILAAAKTESNYKEVAMSDKEINEGQAPVKVAASQEAPAVSVPAGGDHDATAHKAEMQRQALIRATAERLGSDVAAVNKAIAEKVPADDFMLSQLDARATKEVTATSEDIGMGGDEIGRFSLLKLAAYAAASPEQQKKMRMQREDSTGPSLGLTLEACTAAAEKRAKVNGQYSLPNEVLRAGSMTEGEDGGFLVDQRRGSMVEMLSANTKVLQLGAYPLGNLVGDVELPRMDTGLTGYVLDEDEGLTDSSLAWGLLTLQAKTVGATAYLTRSMMRQTSYDVEMLYRQEIARAIALKMDALAISGVGGRTQPIGILNTTGIGAVVGGSAGLAPTWAHIVKLETEVDQDNALMGRTGYLTNAKMRGTMKRTPQHSTANVGGWIWQPYPGQSDPTVGLLNGYPAHVSNQVPSDLVKGGSGAVCSAIIFGNWNDGVIATWGGIDLTIDPYTNSKKGGTQLTAFFDFDFAILRPSSFAAMQDALEAA